VMGSVTQGEGKVDLHLWCTQEQPLQSQGLSFVQLLAGDGW
jgi:hypothetical protein